MSVPKSKRSVPKCIAVQKAKDLVEYVLLITNNEKSFKPEYKALTNDIVHCTEHIFIDCYTANNVYVSSKEKLYLRISYQKSASNECKNLLGLIQLAYGFNHLDSKRVDYWTSKVKDTQETIKAWSKANRERYQNFK